jgi:hypothetical protein
MKKIVASRFLTLLTLIVTLTIGFAAKASAEDPACSMARAAGKWSMTDVGTVIGIGPRTAVGVFKLDADGNLTNGVAASSLNGSVASETFSGSYTVNADCSGSFDAKIYANGTEIFEITAFVAFDNNMKEMRAVFTSVATPTGGSLPTVINLEARKQ